ncbi:MAG: GIVxVP protein [Synechococcaceae cyanobacterium]
MGLHRTAKGIVLVPSLLLGGAFLAAASWSGDGPAAANRPLALGLGGLLMVVGLLAQLLPEPQPEGAEPESAAGAPADRIR